MAVSAYATGTKTVSSVGTEESLTTATGPGTFTLHVDKNAMAAGDILELRIKQMVLTGGTARVAYYARWDGAQPTDDQIAISVPISNELNDAGALDFRLNQLKGSSAKAFPWKVLKYS